MTFEIYLPEGNAYVNVRIKEAVTPEVLKAFLRETAKAAQQTGLDRYVFDLRQAPNQSSLTVHYDFVYAEAKKYGFRPGSKHALLTSSENQDDYSFVETILNNAGFQSKLFTEEKRAIDWIKE